MSDLDQFIEKLKYELIREGFVQPGDEKALEMLLQRRLRQLLFVWITEGVEE